MPRLSVQIVIASLLAASGARAEAPAPLSAQTLKLPSGPSSLKGLGESFAPNPATGTGAFSVPIALPPGFVSPSVALQYNGGFGKGPFGNGWRLPAFRIYRTTDKGLPRFNEEDRFAVEGPGFNDELVLVDPEARTYRLKNEGAFALFVRHRDTDSWSVRLANGHVAVLGVSFDSRQGNAYGTYRWWAESIADRFGHELVYEYEHHLGQVYLSALRYNGQGGEQYENRLEITYEARPDVFTDYTYGAAETTSRRVQRLDVYHGIGRLMRSYALSYASDGLNSVLSRVEMTGEGGALSMPPLTFEYAHEGAHGATLVDAKGPPALDLLRTGEATLEDVNGDALPDLLVGTANDYHYYENLDGQQFAQTATHVSASPDHSLWEPGCMLVDADGDGFRDVLAPHGNVFRYYSGGQIEEGSLVRFGNGRDLAPTSDWDFDWSDPRVRLADLNLDGRTDLMLQGAGSATMVVNSATGELVESALLALPLDVDFQDERVQLRDFNGDGILDFVRVDIRWDDARVQVWHGLGWGRYTSEMRMSGVPRGDAAEYSLQDVNGDGQADLLWVSGTLVRYYLNDGNGHFLGGSADMQGLARTDVERQLFADINGNGTTDVVWVTRDQRLVYLDMASPFFGLLVRIDNGTGAVTTISYRTSTSYLVDAKLDNERWHTPLTRGVPVIAEMRTTDSLDRLGFDANETVTLFAYRDGYFDTREREFRGFARVRVTSVGDELHETQVTDTHFHVGRNLETGADEEVLKGKPVTQVVMNADGEIYSTTETRWERQWLWQEDLPAGSATLLPRRSNGGDLQARKDQLVALAMQTGALAGSWEKTSAPRYTWTAQEYDVWGNVVSTDALGEVAFDVRHQVGSGLDGFRDVPGDEVYTRATFINQAVPESWLIGLPLDKQVLDRSGVVASHERTFYDGAIGYDSADEVSTQDLISVLDGLTLGRVTHGLVTRQDAWLDTEDRWIRTSGRAYDANGQLLVQLDANDNRREYEYDAATGLFLVRESVEVEAGRLDFTADYDHGLGQIIDAWDFNSAHTRLSYDGLGRLSEVYDAIHTCEPVQRYEYYYGTAEHPISTVVTHALVQSSCPGSTPGDGTPSAAVYHTSNVYTDGLGRTRLSVMEAEEPHGYVASGWQELSARGAAVRSFESFATSDWGLVAAPVSTPSTLQKLDALDRPVRVEPPQVAEVPTYSRTVYLPFETQVFDERDSLEAGIGNNTPWCFPALSRVDGQGRAIEIMKHNDGAGGSGGCGARLSLDWHVEYDVLGNITRLTDPQDHPRDYAYDSLARMTWLRDPNAGELWFSYDDAGNLLERVDAKGQSILNSYGLANRIESTELVPASSTDPSTLYTYHYDAPDPRYPEAENLLGRVAAIKGPLDGLYWSYDELGRVVRTWRDLREQPVGTYQSYELLTSYDPQGKPTAAFYPGGLQVSYQYNRRQLLESVIAGFEGDDNVVAAVTAVAYDATGAVTQQDYANGVSTWREYDVRHRLRALTTGLSSGTSPFQSLQYDLSPTGLIERVVDLTTPDATIGVPRLDAEYDYDRLYQLTAARTSRGEIDYAYDTIQNLIRRSSTIPGLDLPLGDFGYGENGAGPNQITSAGDERFTYDAAGQMRSHRGFALTFDAGGRLTRAENADGTRVDNAYDVGGERLLKRVRLPDGTRATYRYVFDSYQERNGEPVWILRAGEGKVAEIRETRGLQPDLWQLDALVGYAVDPASFPQPAPAELLDADGDGDSSLDAADLRAFARRYLRGGLLTEPVTVVQYYHRDPLGTPTHTTDSTGRLVSFARFHPYGWESEEFGTRPVYGFTGAEREPGTDLGLTRMGARWYSPRVGRWVSADPLLLQMPRNGAESALELGLYAYALNSPLSCVDPTGLLGNAFPASNPQIAAMRARFDAMNSAGGADPQTAAEEAYRVHTELHSLLGDTMLDALGSLPGPTGGVAAFIQSAGDIERGDTLSVGLTVGGAIVGGILGKYGGKWLAKIIKSTIGRNADEVGRVATRTSRARRAGAWVSKYWNKSVTFGGKRVFQRSDLFDPHAISSWKVKGRTVTGTNIERMASGRAPIGIDGKAVNLHHLTQTEAGSIAEVSASMHQQYYQTLHINTGSLPSGIDRAAFDAWRSSYWMNRAKGF